MFRCKIPLLWFTLIALSRYNPVCGANVPLPMGVVFDQGTAEVQAAFKHALMTFTPLNVTRYSERGGDYGERFGFTAYVDTINTADAFKLSKLICTQFSRGIFAMVGAMNPESFQTYHSYANTFEMPIIIPWYPMKSEKVSEYNSWDNPPAAPKMDFAIRLRPDLHQTILDTIQHYGWKNIIYLYNSNEALLGLQSLLQRLTLTDNPLRLTVIKKIANVQDAIDVLRDIESSERLQIIYAFVLFGKGHQYHFNEIYRIRFPLLHRFSPKYILLDCPINLAKDIIVAHVRNIHLGRRTYHYLLGGLAFDEPWDETKEEFYAVNVTGFRMIDPNRKIVKDFLHKWATLDKNQFEGAGKRSISSNAALMYDGMMVVREAFTTILNDNPRALQRKVRDFTCSSGPGFLDTVTPSEHGRTINGHLRRVHVEALTGNIQFHENGTRKFFTIDVMELGSGNNKLRKIGEWTDYNGFSAVAKNAHNQYSHSSLRRPSGLENKVYIATSILVQRKISALTITNANMEEPYLMRKKLGGHHVSGNELYEGFCKDLMDEISKQLNFTYEIKLSMDGRHGSENPNAQAGWDGMVGELIREEADIAITPLSITAERERVIEFSKPYITTGISIMAFKPKRSTGEVFSFLTPLSTSIWFCVLAAYLCVSAVVYIVARFSPTAPTHHNQNGMSKHENHNNHPLHPNSINTPSTYATTSMTSFSSPYLDLKGRLSMSNALWYSFCVLTHRHQTTSVIKRSWAAKVVGMVWWLFALILVSSYTANFIALRTRNKIVSPIRSAQDLLESGYHNRIQYGTVYGSSTYEFFQLRKMRNKCLGCSKKNSEAQVFRAMFEHMGGTSQMNMRSNEEGIKWVRQKRGKYAFLLDSAINDYTNRRQPCNTMRGENKSGNPETE
ncbi:Glutamate receptor 1, partial [Orchesella cincta]